jgi:hypothetical protein
MFWLKVLVVAFAIALFVWISVTASTFEPKPHGKRSHRWKNSWPGNFCLDCGEADSLENTDRLVDCPECFGGLLREPMAGQLTCQRCNGVGCVTLPVEETTCPGVPT